jgi:hypothetical protein
MDRNNKSNFTDKEFIKITQNCQTMAQASKLLGMSYKSFRKKAIELNCFKTNQSGKGIKKNVPSISIEDILAGKYPSYQTYKLKKRLIEEGYLEDKCSICGWNKKPEGSKFTSCELDHINGNPTDHRLENLRIICPNCHSLTKTYRFRRGKTNEAQGRKLLDAIEANSTNSK